MWPALVYVVEESNLGLANGMLDTVQRELSVSLYDTARP